MIAHAEAEEHEELDQLAAQLDGAQLERMRKAASWPRARRRPARTPGVESEAANLLAGPFAAMLDRARDLIGGKR